MRSALLAFLLVLTGCFAHPNITLKEQPRAAIEISEVAVLTALPPSSYTVMAQVYGWSPIPVDTLRGYDMAVGRLRERAASIGANAVLVPRREEITWPRIRSMWMWPDSRGRFRDDEDVRPSELRGTALYIPAN